MKDFIRIAAESLEALGIGIIILGIIWALIRYLARKLQSYDVLRKEIGKAILLGLEILVGADIIATVVTEPTMDKVVILGIIVLIRTFLSFSLEVEIDGSWPWQKQRKTNQ